MCRCCTVFMLTFHSAEVFLSAAARKLRSNVIKVSCRPLILPVSPLHASQRETPTAVNMCSPHWTIGHLSACPNCACWQWLGLAVDLVLSETVERPGFHSHFLPPVLTMEVPSHVASGPSPAATRNRSGSVMGSEAGVHSSTWHRRKILRRHLNLFVCHWNTSVQFLWRRWPLFCSEEKEWIIRHPLWCKADF